jgi:hypothetical protein
VTRGTEAAEEVWNGRNYEAVSDLYGEKYVNPFGIGPAARAEPIRRYHEAFPDLHIDIEELEADTGPAATAVPCHVQVAADVRASLDRDPLGGCGEAEVSQPRATVTQRQRGLPGLPAVAAGVYGPCG